MTDCDKRIDSYQSLIFKVINILKAEISHEGTDAAMTPTHLLNRIVGLSSELGLEEVREKALDQNPS